MNKKMFSLIFFIKNNYKDEVYVIFFLKIFVPYYLVDHGSMIKKKKKKERERELCMMDSKTPIFLER
jgi:hypothetical protein